MLYIPNRSERKKLLVLIFIKYKNMPSGIKLNLTQEEINQIIIDYNQGVSSRELANKYNIKCSKSIIKILLNNNVKCRSKKESYKRRIFSEEEKIILINEYKKIDSTMTDLAKIVNVDKKLIKKFLIENNIYNPMKFDNYLINKFNIIDTEEKAYWLGFLAADGSVSKKQLSLQLGEKDLEHLLKFKEFIGIDYKIRRRITKLNNKEFIGYRYTISSSKFVRSLLNHNIYPNKGATINIPETIPNNLIHHYIRGLFDGDGCITKRKQLSFSIASSYRMCEQIQEILIKNCNLRKTKLEIHEKHSYIHYCGNIQNKRIYYFLYQDATIFLKRKKIIFENSDHIKIINFNLNHQEIN